MKILNRDTREVILNVDSANLREADLGGANLRYADLRDANLRGANLRYADLEGANLRDANLREADLRDANLEGTNLEGADLEGADLRDANLRYANLVVIQLPFYVVYVQKDYTSIGCKYYTNKEWKSFDINTIASMDNNAIEFWDAYKLIIFAAMDSLNKEIKDV